MCVCMCDASLHLRCVGVSVICAVVCVCVLMYLCSGLQRVESKVLFVGNYVWVDVVIQLASA